jgi:hypothetical protein
MTDGQTPGEVPKFVAPVIQDNPTGWGPCEMPDQFKDMPYQPFSKGDRLGKISDWTGAAFQDKKYASKSQPTTYKHMSKFEVRFTPQFAFFQTSMRPNSAREVSTRTITTRTKVLSTWWTRLASKNPPTKGDDSAPISAICEGAGAARGCKAAGCSRSGKGLKRATRTKGVKLKNGGKDV